MPKDKKEATTNAEPMTHTSVRLPPRGTIREPEESAPAAAPAPATPTKAGGKK